MGKYSKERSRENYRKDKLSSKSKSSNDHFNIAIKSLDRLCIEQFNVESFDVVIVDVLKMSVEQRDDEIVGIIQEWVNLLAKTKLFVTIKGELSAINKYLKYRKIRVEFNDEIEFPQNLQEERYALNLDEIRIILNDVKFKQKGYYLCLISSGCRPIEVLGLKKKDYFWSGKKYGALIPAALTKKKIARTIFFSEECTPFLGTLLKQHEDEQTIFTKNKNLRNARTSEDSILHKHLEKLGMDYKFETTGNNKINLYCFRGYFFTKAIKIFNEDIAHAMIGHGAYLQQYQRRNQKEKEELFDEMEGEILVYDLSKKDDEIKKLKFANNMISQQNEKIDNMERKMEEDRELAKKRDKLINEFLLYNKHE